MVSVNATGTDSGNAGTEDGLLSADGTKVVFHSSATDIGPAATAGGLYIRDLTTGTTSLVSVNAAGTDSVAVTSGGFSMNADATKIAFTTRGSTLGPTDTNGVDDVYLRDLTTGTTTLVSTNAAGTNSANGFSSWPVVSPDGTKVVFHSGGNDFGPVDTTATCLGSPFPPVFVPCPDVYVRDLATGTTELLTVNAAGTNSASFSIAELGDTRNFAFSVDSTELAFTSTARDLVAPAVLGGPERLYVRDLEAGTTVLASTGAAADRHAQSPVFSPDGSMVGFVAETGGFLHDVAAGTTTALTVNGESVSPEVFSPDGSQLYVGTPSGVQRVDLATGTATLVVPHASQAKVSADGNLLAFVSREGGYGPTDTNDWDDIYVRDLTTGATTLVTGNGTDTLPFNTVGQWQYSAAGRRVVFRSVVSGYGPTDTNEANDLYVVDLYGADLVVSGSIDAGTTYTLDVANDGPDAAEDATVALLLPDGSAFVDADGDCLAHQQRLVVCELGALAAGDDVEVTITASGTAGVAIARVQSATVEVDHTDNQASIGG